MTVVATPRNGSPAPAAMPIPAAAQRLAAVVRPRTDGPYLMIAPAPRNPMPVTICAATRDGSVAVPSADGNPTIDSTVNSADPSDTSRWVRIPAGWSWISRSIPMTAPRTAAISSRPTRTRSVPKSKVMGRSVYGPGSGVETSRTSAERWSTRSAGATWRLTPKAPPPTDTRSNSIADASMMTGHARLEPNGVIVYRS